MPEEELLVPLVEQQESSGKPERRRNPMMAAEGSATTAEELEMPMAEKKEDNATEEEQEEPDEAQMSEKRRRSRKLGALRWGRPEGSVIRAERRRQGPPLEACNLVKLLHELAEHRKAIRRASRSRDQEVTNSPIQPPQPPAP